MDVNKASIEELRQRIKELEAQLSECQTLTDGTDKKDNVVRPKIAQMSAEVVDSNPYSRLMALKRMGIVDNYEVK